MLIIFIIQLLNTDYNVISSIELPLKRVYPIFEELWTFNLPSDNFLGAVPADVLANIQSMTVAVHQMVIWKIQNKNYFARLKAETCIPNRYRALRLSCFLESFTKLMLVSVGENSNNYYFIFIPLLYKSCRCLNEIPTSN